MANRAKLRAAERGATLRAVFQRDYLMRAIQQAAEALAGALRLLRARKPDEAEQSLREGYAALGIDRELLLLLDAPSLRSQLVDDEKIAMAVRLLLGDAELRLAAAERTAATRRWRAAGRLAEQLREPAEEIDSELARVRAMLGLG